MSDAQPGELTETNAAPRRASWLARFGGPLVLLALVLIVFGDILVMPRERMISHTGSDAQSHGIWWRGFGFRELRAGNLALWNPHVYGGSPFHGSFASALLYPPNWLEMVLPPHVAQNWYLAIHLYLAGLFTYACCRARGLSPLAGTLAGAMFMFGGPYFLHVYPGHPTVIGGMTWAPLVLLALDRWTDPSRLRWIVAGAFGVAMQVYAGAQHFYLGGIVFGVYAALLAIAAAGPWRRRLRPLAGFGAIYGLAVLISAAQLFPAIEARPESARGAGVPIEFAATFSLPPENLATLLSPHVFGAIHDEAAPYFGRAYLWEVCLFVSVTGLLLGMCALLQRDARRRFAGVMVVVSIVLALGYHTPLFKLLYYYLPGYNTFRGSAKFGLFAALFLAVLAGIGLDQLALRDRRALRRRLVVLLTAIALIGLAAMVVRDGNVWSQTVARIHASGESEVRNVDLTNADFIRLSAQRAADQLLLAFGAAGVVAALVWLHGRTRRAAYILVAVAMLELVVFARRYVATTDARPPLPEPWQKLLTSSPGDYRVVLPAERWANWGMLYDFQNLYGYDSSSITSRFAELLAFSQGRDPDSGNQYVKFTQYPRYFDMLRTRFVLLPDVNKPYIELPGPLPHAVLVSNYHVGNNRDEILARLADPSFDARRLVLLESEPAITPEPAGGRGTVSVTTVSTDELHIDVDVPAPTILVVTDNYSRFWRAAPRSPGPQATYDVLPANWILRAIPLQAGKHQIRMHYEPRGVRLGFITTGITLATLAAAALLMPLRRRFGSRSRFPGSDNLH